MSAYSTSLILFLQLSQKDRQSVHMFELFQVLQEQIKATNECDQKIFLIKEQIELSQLNEALFHKFFHQSYLS